MREHSAKGISINLRCDLVAPLLAAKLLHCLSVSVPISVAPLAREQVLGIDPATRASTARGGHALGVAGELAIAGIAPNAPLQAVGLLYVLDRRGRHRSRLSMALIVSFRRRRRTRIIRVGVALKSAARSRRRALGHRIVAAILVGSSSRVDDVHANRKSRVICLSPGVPWC